MLPDKTTKCHRTGFTLTCFDCVTQHGCRLWKRVILENDPNNSAPGQPVKPIDHYDCVDSLVDLYLKDQLRRQLQTTHTVDNLRREVHEANAVGMASAMMGINQQLRVANAQQQAALENGAAPKLIGSE